MIERAKSKEPHKVCQPNGGNNKTLMVMNLLPKGGIQAKKHCYEAQEDAI